jgi:hypothetical protein
MSSNPRPDGIRTRSKILRSPPCSPGGMSNVNEAPMNFLMPTTAENVQRNVQQTPIPAKSVELTQAAAPSFSGVQLLTVAQPQTAAQFQAAIQPHVDTQLHAADQHHTTVQVEVPSPQAAMNFQVLNHLPFGAQQLAMPQPQSGGSEAEPGVKQLLHQLQFMVRELDNRFSARMGEMQANFTTRFGELSNYIDNLKDDIKDQFVSRISQNEDNIAVHETRLNDVEVAVRSLRNEAEAATKVNDLIIKGVPMTADEDLTGLYCKIATALGYSPAQIPHAEIHRLGRKRSDAKYDPPLLLKFGNFIDRKKFYSNYFLHRNLNLSEIGSGTTTQRIYITENLTKQNQEIYATAMRLRYEKKILSVSTSNGVVMVRRQEGGKPTPVFSLTELGP